MKTDFKVNNSSNGCNKNIGFCSKCIGHCSKCIGLKCGNNGLWKSWIFFYFVFLESVHGAQNISNNNRSFSDEFNQLNISCRKNSSICTLEFDSSPKVIDEGRDWLEKIFNEYLDQNSRLTVNGLGNLLKSLRIIKPSKTVVTNEHDKAEIDGDHDEQKVEKRFNDSNFLEDTDDSSGYYDMFGFFDDYEEDDQCLESVNDVLNLYYPDMPPSDIQISLSDFFLVMPRLLYELQSYNCRPSLVSDDDPHGHEDHDAEHGESKDSPARIWCIALVSVACISLLSLIGIMIVPLMRHSNSFHRLLSFLVSLAVGTLVGDALLHLLPHAMGGHDHDHAEHASEEDKSSIIKSLVAVLGVYVFFLFESGMSLIRERRKDKRRKKHSSKSQPKSIDSRLKSDESIMMNHAGPNGDCRICPSQDVTPANRISNGVIYSSVPSKVPPFPLKLPENHCDEEAPSPNSRTPESSETEVDECEKQHGHHDFVHAHGVKDLAWMVIAGDGLHNFSDGLAIGAAFSTSVSAGLSTSLAIFCHELPHEFGDFAILIDAGMSIKKALCYNAMSACVAFIGAVIGLAVGEYAKSVKIWILAITAGGFLYVGLVDMLPQMLRQCVEKDGKYRFLFQNIGFLLGVAIMLLIAWFEDAFLLIFNVPHGH